jgi:putative ABC transport system permease protein
MQAWRDDVRQALRVLRTAPGFALASLFMLALGIGANAAIFTVIDAVLLRPLPFTDARQLVRITADLTGRGARDVGVGIPELFEYQQQGDIFETVSGDYPINANLTGSDEPERLEAQLVSTSYFAMLRANARIGRVFGPSDYQPGISEVTVITDGLWKRRFGQDPNIIGRKVRLDDDAYTIIGVLPPGFRHPGRGLQREAELWMPAGYRAKPFGNPQRGPFVLAGAIARLQPGVTVSMAQARLDQLAAAAMQQFPDAYPRDAGWRPRVLPLQDHLAGSARQPLLLLFGAVGMVLLIACANVANLLLARASARRREFAIRQALGAGTARIVRQLLTESVLLALIAGALGVLLASWSLTLLVKLAPADVPMMTDLAIDQRVLIFSIVVSALTGIVFGIVPARHAARTDPQDTLKDAGRSATAGAVVHRWRHALVVAEFALALILLIGATLLVRSFVRLYAVDPGFDPTNVITARMWMPQPNDPATGRYFSPAARVRLYRQSLQRLTERPDVEAAGWISRLPFDGAPRGVPMMVEGRSLETAEIATSEMYLATAGYFQALRVPLMRGRLFTDHDDANTPPVILVNERFARKFFPTEDPIGRRIRPGRANSTAPWLTIVGIVGNIHNASLAIEPEPQLYRCVWQISSLQTALVVRGRSGERAIGNAIRSDVFSLDPELPVFGIAPLTDLMAAANAQRRFSMILFGLFAVVALVLATVGIYAMMAYLVRQRTHEIGIRLALGARPVDAIALVLRRGLALTLVGAALGVGGALVVSQMLIGLLYGVSAVDPVSFIGPPLALMLVSVLACYVPALRASRIDPIQTLRGE